MHRTPRPLIHCAALLLVALLSSGNHAAAEDLPYATGRSSVEIEGLQVELNLPAEMSQENLAALVIILHGAGGTATGMAGTLHEWGANGYVVCAPKSKGQVWTTSDVAAVLRIGAHLKSALPIDPKRVHVIGFSNGGWNLPPLAFDEDLRPCSATWVASGCKVSKVPKWAAAGMGVLALAGSNDGNARSARDTVKILDGKVRSVGVRLQPGLGHEWPRKLMPYFKWWMDAMDGRFVPGVDMNFDWGDSLDKALTSLSGRKKGGVIVYAFQASDADDPVAKALQNQHLLEKLRLTAPLGGYGHKYLSASYILVARKRTMVMTPLKDGRLQRRRLFPVGIPSSSQGNVRRVR